MGNFYERKDINDNTIEFKITIPRKEFRTTYQKLLGKQLMDTDIKGFRKGKVPASMVEPQIGGTLRLEAFEELVPQYLMTALEKEDINPVAPPDYKSFPNFDDDEKDLEFTIDITVMPTFTLGDLKKVKVKKEKVSVKDKEVEDALEDMLKNNKTKSKKIDDAWAKEMGEMSKIKEITDLKSMKEYVKKTLIHQKEHALEHQQEDEAMAQAIKLSKIEIPQKAIDYEAEQRERSFNEDMQKRGTDTDSFLKAYGITIEKMREGWQKDAKEALENDVFLNLYAKEKNIQVDEKDLQEQIDSIKKTAPEGTDEHIFEDEQWRDYIRKVMRKEKAFAEFKKEVLKK